MVDSDIIFNGVDFTWTTDPQRGRGDSVHDSKIDLQSVALHEAGHALGLAHPCVDDSHIVSCVDPDLSIMYVGFPGGQWRELLSDDRESIGLLYQGSKESCTEQPEEKTSDHPVGCDCSAGSAASALGPLLVFLLIGVWYRRRRDLPLLALLLCFLPLGPTARATVVEPLNFERLVELSDVIVHAQVVAVQNWEPQVGGRIYTVVEIEVLEDVARDKVGQRLEVLVPGGWSGERKQVVHGASYFMVGEEVVLFLVHTQGFLVQVGVGLGKIRVDRSDPHNPIAHDTSNCALQLRLLDQGRESLRCPDPLPQMPLATLLQELRIRKRAERRFP